jgi:hypoxanthine phosphoribosyltransferase
VSGGPDSLALLVLSAHARLAVTAVHVDHGLRPESAAEADVVAAVADRVGAAFRSERARVDDGPNLEARARAARLGVLPDDALTGHTADDRAETILINLMRGAGSPGLTAMGPSPRRPLLALRRSETAALCADLGLDPVVDPMNRDPRFVRNRVRHELLPLMAEVAGRDPVPVLNRQADLMGEEVALLAELAESVDATDARALADAPLPLARRPGLARPWPAGRRWPPRSGPARGCGGPRDRCTSTAAVDVGSAVRPSLAPMGGPSGAHDDPRVDPHLGEILVTSADIQAKVRDLGSEITDDYADNPPLLVCVLKGAFLFMADLSRAIDLPVEVDFMAVSSYGAATKTSGVVRIVKDLDIDLSDRHVLLVEDIVDSGLTLRFLRRNLLARNPASVEVCSLLVREGAEEDSGIRYVGFRPGRWPVRPGLRSSPSRDRTSSRCSSASAPERVGATLIRTGQPYADPSCSPARRTRACATCSSASPSGWWRWSPSSSCAAATIPRS